MKKCPTCGAAVVLFPEHFKCIKGHSTPLDSTEVERLARIQAVKVSDYFEARWRPMDYSARGAEPVDDRLKKARDAIEHARNALG
jgi:hypothetical protein